MLQAWDIVVVDGMDDGFHHKGVFLILERQQRECSHRSLGSQDVEMNENPRPGRQKSSHMEFLHGLGSSSSFNFSCNKCHFSQPIIQDDFNV